MRASLLAMVACLGVSASVLGAGCGPGAVGDAVRPADPTAASALGDDAATCHDVESGGEPLVVDWKLEQRGDLEEAMHDGVAVVEYSCKGIRLIKGCRIEGNYGFLGMTKREQVVRLQSSDEVKANLPSMGGAMALSLGGELARGATLDVAMITVGKKRTTWEEPTVADLKGKCDGATHYVRGALVGAFVMKTGTKGKVEVAGEMFGVKAGGASSSEKDVTNQDGDPADCQKSSPDADKAPAQCGAAVRLSLGPIAKAAAEPSPDAKPSGDLALETVCPKGLVLTEGKCADPASATAYLCKIGDEAECTAQCDKGNAGSCGALGSMYAEGYRVAQSAEKASELLKKGCDGDDPASCVNLGRLTSARDAGAEAAAAAAALFEKGCSQGDARGCGHLGLAYEAGKGVTADQARAATLLMQACAGGEDTGCAAAARMYEEGRGVSRDAAKAAELHQKACNGSVADSCQALGVMHETGAGVRKDPIYASMLYRRGCYRNSPTACVSLGRILHGGGAGGSPDEAKRMFEMGCDRQVALGCAALKVAFSGTRSAFPNVAEQQALLKSCQAGNARDCATVGVLDLAAGNKQGQFNLDTACMRGDAWACVMAKKK